MPDLTRHTRAATDGVFRTSFLTVGNPILLATKELRVRISSLGAQA
jgi:hypothetical protein